uniref:Uncharacterized protein n=1 Tax=Alexandrium catenella TaxID=2925 RepID=A0A7S1L390_ALECA
MGGKCCKRNHQVLPPEDVPEVAKPPGKVKVHVGPLEIGSDGVVMKPKFNLGITGNGIYALAGVRDVRDGLAAEALTMGMKSYSSEGASLEDVLRNIKAVDHIPGIDDLIAGIAGVTADIVETLGADLGTGNIVTVEGVLHFYVGVGVSAGIYLGWTDTQGYGMVGVEGKAVAATGFALSARFGWHETEPFLRVVGWLPNLGYDAVVKLKARPLGLGAEAA